MGEEPDFATLIPELPRWNGGKGIDPESWIGCKGNPELAIGYSLVLWPRFVRAGRYVLRRPAADDRHMPLSDYLAGWERALDNDRRRVEAMVNHLHLVDLHARTGGDEAFPTEAQLRHLGRVLREIHEVKLRHDFPDLSFEVAFNDEPGLDAFDYQLTFWQTGP